MQVVFLYGPVASGKLTVGRELAARTGFALFHNHLIVDALAAVSPFGSEPFVRLREQMWLDVMGEALNADRSLVFTFAPEPTVDTSFPERLRAMIEVGGGRVRFVALTLPWEDQKRRLVSPGRAAFGKLMSLELLERLRADCDASLAAMPAPELTLDSSVLTPEAAAEVIRLQILA